VRPDAFAAVMATGIVSIAAADHGYRIVSDVLAVAAAVMLAALVIAAMVGLRVGFDDVEVTLPLFTFVAACAVVGTRLASSTFTHIALGIAAALAWLGLMALTARLLWRHRWTGLRDRARGGWELASVATSGLAIIAADLGWVAVAFGLLVLALCLYCLMTTLVIWRAVHEPGAVELRQPDIWIVMGGAAIATLVGDHIHKAGFEAIWPVTVVTWIVASVWIPLLVVVSVRLRGGNWWAAVFPLGMYSSATYATAVETGWAWLTTISLVFFWIAFAAWLVVAVVAISARYRALRAG
jgi:tellurite resistance protein TehA-like permease